MKNSARGFSLLEIIIVVAILGVLGSIAVPFFTGMARQQEVRTQTRMLANRLTKARSLAASGRVTQGGQPAQSAGIRLDSPSAYTVFIDNDLDDAAVEVIESVDLAAEIPSIPLRFQAASFPVIIARFRKNGMITGNSDVDITLHDTETNDTRVVRVSLGGLAKVHL